MMNKAFTVDFVQLADKLYAFAARLPNAGNALWASPSYDEVDRLALRDLSAANWATPKASVLSGMIYEKLFMRFRSNATQVGLLDDRRTV
jgi:hypothetical protein